MTSAVERVGCRWLFENWSLSRKWFGWFLRWLKALLQTKCDAVDDESFLRSCCKVEELGGEDHTWWKGLGTHRSGWDYPAIFCRVVGRRAGGNLLKWKVRALWEGRRAWLVGLRRKERVLGLRVGSRTRWKERTMEGTRCQSREEEEGAIRESLWRTSMGFLDLSSCRNRVSVAGRSLAQGGGHVGSSCLDRIHAMGFGLAICAV